MGVLDDMTKGVLDAKKDAAGPKLTPVGTEASPVKPSLPQDVPGAYMAGEQLADAALFLRDKAAQLIAIAEGLDEMLQIERAAARVDPVAEEKKANAAADAKFSDKFKAQQKAAQAATYTGTPDKVTQTDVVDLDVVSSGPEDWSCPDHAEEDIQVLTARPSGRKYRACMVEDCAESE